MADSALTAALTLISACYLEYLLKACNISAWGFSCCHGLGMAGVWVFFDENFKVIV